MADLLVIDDIRIVRGVNFITAKLWCALSYFPSYSHLTELVCQICLQIYFCLRTGYHEEALGVARTSRVSQQFTTLVRVVEMLLR